MGVPEEVQRFFNWKAPDPAGVEVKIDALPWKNDYAEGVEIDVAALPPDVKKIRFYNSW